MDLSTFANIIQTILILIFVIFIANISLKFVNKNVIRHNKLIKIIEKVALSNSSSIGVVKICEQYYLMSFTGTDNKVLKELDIEQVENILKITEEDREITLDKTSLNNFLRMRGKN